MQRFDGVIRHAMATGEVSFAAVEQADLARPPSPQIARLQQMAEEVGGIDALERIACGGDDEAPEGSVPKAVAEPEPPRAVPSPPAARRAVVRRIWDRLFRSDGSSDSEGGRKAG